jgi:hypothetical protein
MARHIKSVQGMVAIRDLTGQRFSRLTVISLDPERTASGKARWLCRCDCGTELIVTGGNLCSGNSESCGCYSREVSATINKKHGMSYTKEFGIWLTMNQRCSNPAVLHYDRYGGRGIAVCDRWIDSFEAFYADMGPRPTTRHTIERRDNDKDYEPDNCYWATYAEQGLNKINTVRHPDGIPLAIKAREAGLSPKTVYARLWNGWTIERALSTPVGVPKA